jgi:hypothetical protein
MKLALLKHFVYIKRVSGEYQSCGKHINLEARRSFFDSIQADPERSGSPFWSLLMGLPPKYARAHFRSSVPLSLCLFRRGIGLYPGNDLNVTGRPHDWEQLRPLKADQMLREAEIK